MKVIQTQYIRNFYLKMILYFFLFGVLSAAVTSILHFIVHHNDIKKEIQKKADETLLKKRHFIDI